MTGLWDPQQTNQFTLCQPSGWSLTDQPAGSFCLAPPWFRLNHVEFTRRKEKKNMICPVTILHLRCSFLPTPSLNKNWIHRIAIGSNWKTCYFNGSGWREGIFCPTKRQQPMGAKRGTTTGGTWQRVNCNHYYDWTVDLQLLIILCDYVG